MYYQPTIQYMNYQIELWNNVPFIYILDTSFINECLL